MPVFAVIAAIVVAVIAAAYVLWTHYNNWVTQCHEFLPSLSNSEVEQVLRANLDRRLRITFTDGVIQNVAIGSVDDEGFLHSGPDGEIQRHTGRASNPFQGCRLRVLVRVLKSTQSSISYSNLTSPRSSLTPPRRLKTWFETRKASENELLLGSDARSRRTT